MAKLNFQLQLNREKDSEILEMVESYIFSFNLMTRMSSSLKPMVTEIYDNSDGTVEIRLLDFEFEPNEWMQDSDKAVDEFLQNVGMTREDILTHFNYTGEPKDEN